MFKLFRSAALLSFLAFTFGCSSGSSGGSGDPPPPPPPPPTLEPTLGSIQSNVFTPSCASCHAGGQAPEGLLLDSAQSSHTMLVGVDSNQVPSLLRVDPGNPDDSYLIQKLEGTAAIGNRMPDGAPALAQSTIDVIRQWIVDGAQDNGDASGSTKPVQASTASIVPNSMVDALPDRIIVGFDRELDASTVHAGTVSLWRSGGDGSFDDGNEIEVDIYSVGVPLFNLRSLTVDLTGVPDIEDVYRLVLSGSPPSAILDLGGNRLDGNWVQTFPSGDGTEGGDLEIEFTVRRMVD